jgi:iron complex outermembrane receptor protein
MEKCMLKKLGRTAALLTAYGSIFAAALPNDLPKIAAVGQEKQENKETDKKGQKKEPKLGEVTVVVTADKEVLEHVHSRVTMETMELLNASNVAAALFLLPGASFAMNSRAEMTINLRGNDSRRVPVFLDGIPSYVPYDGQMDFGRFSTFDLSEIQVAKGFSSIAFGPNTMGGAINLVTKKPSEKFDGNAILGASDGDGKTAAVNVGSALDSFYVQAGGSFRDSGDFRMSSNFVPTPTAEGGRRLNSDFSDSKLSAKFGFSPSSSGEYVLGYSIQKGEKGQPLATEGDRAQPNRLQFWRWPTWDKENIYFLSHVAIGVNSYIKLRAYHDTYKNIINYYTDQTYSVIQNNGISIYDDFTNGAMLEAGTTLFGNQSIRGIAQIKRDIHRADSTGNNNWSSYKDELRSIGIEDSITVNKKLDLSLGFGLDSQKPLETGQYNNLETQTFLQGQFGAFYKITDKLQTYFTFARKDRFPTLRDRFSLRFDRNIENPDLKPELSTNYDIGAKALLLTWLQIEGAAFYSDITDLIEEVANVTSDGKSQYQNIGKVKQQGIELSFFVKPTTWFETGVYYTYLHRENLSSPGIRLREVPKNRITGFTKVEPLKQLHFIASVQCQDNVWASNTARLAGYATANVTIGYKPFRGILVDGGFSNVLDKNYQQTLGYPLPGRSWFINGRYNF